MTPNTPSAQPVSVPSSEKSVSSSGSTPLTSRRTSFLSQTMIDNESFSIYDSYTFSRGASSYHIISLKESQGFMFNQDLFASTYQQSRTSMREKQARALRSKKRSKSHSGASRWSIPSTPQNPHQRRHTTYGSGPMLRIIGGDSAVEDDSSDDMCIDEHAEKAGHTHAQSESATAAPRAIRFAETRDFSREIRENRENRTAPRDDTDNEEDFEWESDGSEAQDFTPIGSNYVPVIDISVEDMDHVPDI